MHACIATGGIAVWLPFDIASSLPHGCDLRCRAFASNTKQSVKSYTSDARSPRAPGGSPTPHTIGAHTYTPALRTVHVSQQCNQVRVRARRCVQSHPHMRIPVRCRAYAVIVGTCLRTQHPAMASSFQSSRGGTCRLLTWLRVASLCSQLLGARDHLICHHQT